MSNMKSIIMLLAFLVLMPVILTGCESDTVETCVLSNEQYTEKEALESAKQPESISTGHTIYASVHFIESPLGMEYTGKWYLDGKEQKSETHAMTTDKSGIIVFSLESDMVTEGTLRFEIIYRDDVLFTKELPIQ